MASTTALFTGLSGLTANARNLDVIGNNIANVNTTAYKSNRMLFADAFSRNFSIGSAPSTDNGGTNPGQIGLGVTIAGTQRDFSGGALSATGDPRDLAIEGSGFFIVNRAGNPYYTRAGSFRQNATDQLVTISGERVQGFGVDSQFNIIPGALTDLTIPVGSLTLAEATKNVRFSGNLNAAGSLPTTGTNINFDALSLVTGPIGGPGGNLLETTSLLTQVNDPANPGSALLQAGQSIRLTGAEKGSKTLPDATLAITAASTVQNLMDFLRQALGISTTAGANPNGAAPGLQLNPATGVLSVVGNAGAANDLSIETQDLRLLSSGGAAISQPFVPTKTATADGESVRTTFVAFDSLGAAVSVDLTVALASKTATGTTWRYYVESADDSDLDLQTGTGLVSFDTSGQLIPPGDVPVTINRAGTGAADPLAFTIAFASESDRVTALADGASAIAATFQDGSPIGTLASYGVGQDGVIFGAFTNGLTRTVGQVALATFSNPEGLVDIGSNLFTVGPNSGSAVVTTPQALGAGRVVGGSLELSNVDLSEEFINLILASTGYSASSRVISTTDQLMQQLLVLGR